MNEKRIIILTAILNVIVASLKLIFGIVFSFSTLISDSVQSFIDFFTDIASLIVNKIGKRRANKVYPFGYGQVYYLSNILTGILLFFIGLFIVYQIFMVDNKFSPNLIIIFGLFIALILKLIVIILLQRYGRSTKNELLIESYKESKADFISTCVVIVVLVISFFEKYIPLYINVDKIGSIGISIYVFYTSIKMIIFNVRGIFLNDVLNDEIKDEIREELKYFKNFSIVQIKVIKMSYYYSVFLKIDVNNNIKIKDFIRIENSIKKRLKSFNKLIRFVDIEPI